DDAMRAAVEDASRAVADDAAGQADAEHVHDALARLEEVTRARVDVAEAAAERWHRAATVFAASIAGLLVAGAALLLSGLHRRVVRPLVDLSDCMKGFVAGETAECGVSGAEEIRDVARAFNALSTRLRDQ